VRSLALIGVPIDSVGRGGGAELGPATLRELGVVKATGAVDRGDLDVKIRGEERDTETGIVGSADVLAATAAIRDAVEATSSAGSRPLLLGGCCAELPGALAGARDAAGAIGLAYLDGHLDLYDGVTSPTGEAADMPISVALGLGPERWVEASGGATVRAERLTLIGFRDKEESVRYGMLQPEQLDPEPRQLPVAALRDAGPRRSGERVAAALAADGPFWLHFDVDVLDPDVFPATDYLMPGGLSWDAATEVLRPLAASPALIGASIACYNPDKDPDRGCGRALVEALRLFG
jgi:arginase